MRALVARPLGAHRSTGIEPRRRGPRERWPRDRCKGRCSSSQSSYLTLSFHQSPRAGRGGVATSQPLATCRWVLQSREGAVESVEKSVTALDALVTEPLPEKFAKANAKNKNTPIERV